MKIWHWFDNKSCFPQSRDEQRTNCASERQAGDLRRAGADSRAQYNAIISTPLSWTLQDHSPGRKNLYIGVGLLKTIKKGAELRFKWIT